MGVLLLGVLLKTNIKILLVEINRTNTEYKYNTFTLKIKVTYILSNIDKAVAFEWIAEHLDADKFELSFILLHSQEPFLHRWLIEKGVDSYFIPHFGKKSYPKSFVSVTALLRKIKPDIVHTHLFDANLIGLSAAKLLRIKRRIYTRHHSTFHHDNFPKAIKYDKASNHLATDIIAISQNVKNVLIEKENVPKNKIHLIHHGFDLKKFQNVSNIEIEELRKKYNILNAPVIGIVSRYIKLKGIQYIIPAFKKILKEYPNAILILANANGADKDYIRELLSDIPKKNYREIVFEPNLFALYQLFDVYVHVPIDEKIEAFGQTYVEALAAGVPSVFTLSGVAKEFIVDEENALVVNHCNSEDIHHAIDLLIKDGELRQKLIYNGRKSVKMFNLENFITSLETLYK